ncbi:hypothetical protein WMY93_025663 [Mugilogobius chulae]|uniref:Uncharacterized protein n=1 Tax=Mugilogobius chulae TaxID=88201 RepID=A0AAW0N201_9GOBI
MTLNWMDMLLQALLNPPKQPDQFEWLEEHWNRLIHEVLCLTYSTTALTECSWREMVMCLMDLMRPHLERCVVRVSPDCHGIHKVAHLIHNDLVQTYTRDWFKIIDTDTMHHINISAIFIKNLEKNVLREPEETKVSEEIDKVTIQVPEIEKEQTPTHYFPPRTHAQGFNGTGASQENFQWDDSHWNSFLYELSSYVLQTNDFHKIQKLSQDLKEFLQPHLSQSVLVKPEKRHIMDLAHRTYKNLCGTYSKRQLSMRAHSERAYIVDCILKHVQTPPPKRHTFGSVMRAVCRAICWWR